MIHSAHNAHLRKKDKTLIFIADMVSEYNRIEKNKIKSVFSLRFCIAVAKHLP